ncbi:hypothetical protein HTZ77_29965 [Nonomuraea sp. SMC257]|uniref:Uncharacterized protein n=1 Tax=Nonomuraea montanisoli TaxID=2741721 RepID=A0A7Y6M6I0_9ACTN|nr:hypothetical protein [Nonomuraea montanisoli]NUW35626.1 hypothetical protein [Nonomuraea montanisoli]
MPVVLAQQLAGPGGEAAVADLKAAEPQLETGGDVVATPTLARVVQTDRRIRIALGQWADRLFTAVSVTIGVCTI